MATWAKLPLAEMTVRSWTYPLFVRRAKWIPP
jgi:hypothetical protein